MNFQKVTLQECADLHDKKGKIVILNDGEVVDITMEVDEV